jgi:hypothetical protein
MLSEKRIEEIKNKINDDKFLRELGCITINPLIVIQSQTIEEIIQIKKNIPEERFLLLMKDITKWLFADPLAVVSKMHKNIIDNVMFEETIKGI